MMEPSSKKRPTRPTVSAADIARAAAILVRGGVVAFPTETVYGLGANALDAAAAARVFEVKGRPSFDPLIVHVSSVAQSTACAAHLSQAASRCCTSAT
jgi:Putative translation factor (SUA5)